MVIKLHGLPCHVCGLPADWWIDGLTLPCRCGMVEWADVDRALDQLRAVIVAAAHA